MSWRCQGRKQDRGPGLETHVLVGGLPPRAIRPDLPPPPLHTGLVCVGGQDPYYEHSRLLREGGCGREWPEVTHVWRGQGGNGVFAIWATASVAPGD